jgi:predicted AAA+ superfamily ATPase
VESVLTRHVTTAARQLLGHFPGLVIEGARQTGKSTLARLLGGPDAVVLNLDDDLTRASFADSATGTIAGAGDGLIIIDEVQRVPSVTLAVKASIDADRRPGRFILTGSSSLLRVRGTSDSLAGRVARISLFGLSRGEAKGEPDDFVAAVMAGVDVSAHTSSVDRARYADLLGVGAYPEIRDASPRIRTAWLDAYLAGILNRDLPDLRGRVSPARSRALMRALAGRQANELVKARLAGDAGIPEGTITGYLDLLHDVGLLASLPSWTPNLAKREIGRPKTFVIDSALALRLARLAPRQLTHIEYGEAFGSALEAFVAAELLRQRTWSAQDFDVFHYRDRDGDEVDLIIELADGNVIAVEVKASPGFGPRQFAGLRRMRDRLGTRFVAGIVLNTGTTGVRLGDRLVGAPVAALWELHPQGRLWP